MRRLCNVLVATVVAGCGGNVNDAALAVVFTRVASLTNAGGAANERSAICSISGDGRYVAFDALASNLAQPGDTNGLSDVFVRDMVAGTTRCLSVTAGGAFGNGASVTPAISADGRYVAFVSLATNLVADDADVLPDVYRCEIATGVLELVSRPTGLVGKANITSLSPSISDDGRYIAFHSAATNLDPADADATLDVFRRDAQTNTTVLVSRADGLAGAKGNGASTEADISGDGNVVVFETLAGNLDPLTPGGAADTVIDLIWRDVSAGDTQVVMYQAFDASVSMTGQFVAFSSENAFVLGLAVDLNQAADSFVKNMTSGISTRVSVHSRGIEGVVSIPPGLPTCSDTTISSDGRYVAFASLFINLVDVDTNGVEDIFVHDTLTKETVRASVTTLGVEANENCLFPVLARGGNFVCFASLATNLGDPDTNAAIDVFVRGPLR